MKQPDQDKFYDFLTTHYHYPQRLKFSHDLRLVNGKTIYAHEHLETYINKVMSVATAACKIVEQELVDIYPAEVVRWKKAYSKLTVTAYSLIESEAKTVSLRSFAKEYHALRNRFYKLTHGVLPVLIANDSLESKTYRLGNPKNHMYMGFRFTQFGLIVTTVFDGAAGNFSKSATDGTYVYHTAGTSSQKIVVSEREDKIEDLANIVCRFGGLFENHKKQ